MKDHEVLTILDQQIGNAIGVSDSDLGGDRADALDYYYGRPYGDEVEGQSQVVTREVLETIEWIMPSLLRVFAGGDKTVQFDAAGPEDEDAAQQETDYVNHIFNKENQGFLILHDWFKDALLQKNGYTKIYVEEVEEGETETFDNLSDFELGLLLGMDEVEPLEHTEYQGPGGLIHDVKIRISQKVRKIRAECVPSEELGIAKKHRDLSLRDATFVYHRTTKTVSELIEQGYDAGIVKELPDAGNDDDQQQEQARAATDGDDENNVAADDSMREKDVYECYIKMDYDGDGIAELRKITKSGNKVLDNEEIDFIPFPALCPVRMPHKHVGLSVADLVMDLQRIKSTLLRQILNNLYLTNNPQKEVVDKKVNLADLMTSVPGGLVRVKEAGSVREITVPFTAGASMPFLEVLDGMKEGRTGVSRHTMGLDADALAQSTKGAFMGALDQANQRIEMIARMFAETGVKELFLMIHELAINFQDQEKSFKPRNDWVTVNPKQWKRRESMTATVGLGTGNKDQLLQRLFVIAKEQKEHLMAGSPLVKPKNLFHTYERIVENTDLKDVNLYFTDPDSAPPQATQGGGQGQPNPLAEAEAIKQQGATQREQMKLAQKTQSDQMNAQIDVMIEKMRIESKEATETMKAEVGAMLEGFKLDLGKAGIGAGMQEGGRQ